MKLILALLLVEAMLISSSFKTCKVEYSLMYAIAQQEKHPKRLVGYPYLISINRSDLEKAKKIIKKDWIDKKRTIDCKNEKRCITYLKKLIQNRVFNMDLGAFQINYFWHRDYKLKSYFSLDKSYKIACDLVISLYKKYGWSWETIGRYHINPTNKKNKRRNKQYYKKVYKNYQEIKGVQL